MKLSLFPFALLIILSVPFMLKIAVVTSWYANRKEITEKYCINKTRPKLHCDGKCQLSKQLKEIEKNEANGSMPIDYEKIKNIAFSPYQVNSLYSLSQINLFDWTSSLSPSILDQSHYEFLFTGFIFQPPESWV